MILRALPTQWVPRPSRSWRRAGVRNAGAPSSFDHVSKTKSNSTRSIAARPSTSSRLFVKTRRNRAAAVLVTLRTGTTGPLDSRGRLSLQTPQDQKPGTRPALCMGMSGTRALPDLSRENSKAGAEAPSNFVRSTRPLKGRSSTAQRGLLKGRSSTVVAHSRKVRIPTLNVARGATFRMGPPGSVEGSLAARVLNGPRRLHRGCTRS